MLVGWEDDLAGVDGGGAALDEKKFSGSKPKMGFSCSGGVARISFSNILIQSHNVASQFLRTIWRISFFFLHTSVEPAAFPFYVRCNRWRSFVGLT